MSASNVICESTGGYDQGMNAGAGMRIAYVLQWEDGLESGVMKKVRAQIGEWVPLGAQCHVFVLTAEGSVLDRDLRHENVAWLSSFTYRGIRGRFVAARAISRAVEEWQPSLLYSREMALYPPLWSLTRRLSSCLELNSDSRIQRIRQVSPAALYSRVTRHLFFSAFDGFVFVTRELERVVGSLVKSRKSIVIPNGFNLAEVQLCPRKSARPALAFIGSQGLRWHGVDRVLQLAAVLEDWHFDIVGYDESEMFGRFKIGRNVTFHGFLRSPEYRQLLERAVAGIGSVALDRIGLNEACPLKVREYLACGLPVIIGYQDTDFPDGAPFLFRVRGEVDNWRIDELREFLDSWTGKRVPREAIAHLDTAAKEGCRLAFLRTLSTPRAPESPGVQE